VDIPGQFTGTMITIFFVVILVALIPLIFYLIMLQNTLHLVSPELRKMPPGQVWLQIIPVFGIIWEFFVVGAVADSLRAEFHKRNIQVAEARPGYNLGMAMAILMVCSVIPSLGSIAAIAGLVCWIIYWVKIAGYKSMLEQTVDTIDTV